MFESYEIKNNLKRPIMDFIFERRNNTYNLRSFQEFLTNRIRTRKMGLGNLSERFAQLFSILPEILRRINSLVQFKKSLRKWYCFDCPCRLCRLHLPNIWFL